MGVKLKIVPLLQNAVWEGNQLELPNTFVVNEKSLGIMKCVLIFNKRENFMAC